MPPFSASTTAHTRFGFAPETVTPIRPKTASGRPCALISFQVVPPSAERYRPLPGPPLSMLQGVRRACQRAANKILELLGSKVMSIAPVLTSLYRTFSQVFPPSRVRKTPRTSLSLKGCPSAATNAMSGFFGFTISRPMACVSPSPANFHVVLLRGCHGSSRLGTLLRLLCSAFFGFLRLLLLSECRSNNESKKGQKTNRSQRFLHRALVGLQS